MLPCVTHTPPSPLRKWSAVRGTPDLARLDWPVARCAGIAYYELIGVACEQRLDCLRILLVTRIYILLDDLPNRGFVARILSG